MSRLALLALTLISPALVSPALAQYEGAAATRRQKLVLAPLAEATSARLALHLSSFSAADLKSRVEKALFNQVSHVVEKHFKQLVVELLIEDLGLSKKDSNKIQYDVLPGFGKEIPDLPEDLLAFEGKSWASRDMGAYKVTGVSYDHRALIMRTSSGEAEYRLGTWIGREPDKDQARGLKELGEYWATRFEREFGFERKDRKFHDLMVSVFLTLDTERAVMGSLVKLRYLLRPGMQEALQVEGFAAIMEAEIAIADRIERDLTEAEWWPGLQADHRAMVADSKTQRRVLKDRIKAEKAAAKAAAKDDGGR